MRFSVFILALCVLASRFASGAEKEHVTWPKLRAFGTGTELDGTPKATPKDPAEIRLLRGKGLFGTYCARCHGSDGRGGGAAGQGLLPPPTNFVQRAAKFRSTPLGTRPSELDLFRTITRGLHGTAMPAFADLAERDRWALASYVRDLQSGLPEAKPIAIPPTPTDIGSNRRLQRGQREFAELGCTGCHTASQGTPIEALIVKRSRRPEELYLTLVTGTGASMPAYSNVPAEKLWDVISLVRAKLPKPGAIVSEQQAIGVDEVINACQAPPPPDTTR